ncbi:amidohydrolase family protein [Inquilinus sp. OTU3971]|uniref:amidohydrolase family protein n=1 Tax=Inquilinus sp. OTU3971 TaxID=3043855 RepID=UPI00313B1D6F
MIDGTFVFNAVSHACNLSDENVSPDHYGNDLRERLIAIHRDWQPGVGLDAEAQSTDWPVEVLARTLFLESGCDMAATHTLRLDSIFKDGLCRREKTLEAVRRWPQRFVGYVGLDPTLGLDACLRELEEQLEEMRGAVGLKLYPAQVNPHRSWRMDDERLVFPIFDMAAKRGIRTVAIHKAVPYGPVPLAPFRVDDIDLAADAFPDLSFEITHAGMAFTEETSMMLARFPNVYANLEVTSAHVNWAPGLFEAALGQFMKWGGASKIIYADGAMLTHTRPIIESIRRFRFSQRTLDALGIPQITDEDKALILGGNYARILGIDVEAAKARFADDEFSRELARTGLQEPYSNWRRHLQSGAREAA